jgi:hypothetical protein
VIKKSQQGDRSCFSPAFLHRNASNPRELLRKIARTVDHQGVPNSRLVEEESTIAKMYDNKSVAENNSIDVGRFQHASGVGVGCPETMPL